MTATHEITSHSFTFTHALLPSPPSTTHYLRAGPPTGPLLILLHGWIATSTTWLPQLQHLSSQGYLTIAPDTRGYGHSTLSPSPTDYTTETHNHDMLALLSHLRRPSAIWIGHDWGAPLVWSLAAHFPQAVTAVAALCVPYRTLEFGIQHLASLADRDIYPQERYPLAQWEYMRFHNAHPAASCAQLERDPELTMRMLYTLGSPLGANRPCGSALLSRETGWFSSSRASGQQHHPRENECLRTPSMRSSVLQTITRGLSGANAYYLNFPANSAYASRSLDSGTLSMPVLFIHARYDWVCETVLNGARMCAGMREKCLDLQEEVVEAGHWVHLERGEEVNKILVRWLGERVGGCDGVDGQSRLW